MPRKPPPNEAASPFYGLLIIFVMVGVVGWSYLSNRPDYDQTYYAEAISPNLPLPRGFAYDPEQAETLITQEEEVTSVYSEGKPAKFEVLNFYNETLPTLGWRFQKYTVFVDGDQSSFTHPGNDRKLEIKVVRHRGKTQLRLTEYTPLGETWEVNPPFLPGSEPAQ